MGTDKHFITRKTIGKDGIITLICNCRWCCWGHPRSSYKVMRLHLEGFSNREIDEILKGLRNAERT
jgi:hypothetical protein